MSDKKDNEDEESGGTDDAPFRNSLQGSGYKPDAAGLRFMAARPKILVQGAYDVIRTAAAKAREVLSREK